MEGKAGAIRGWNRARRRRRRWRRLERNLGRPPVETKEGFMFLDDIGGFDDDGWERGTRKLVDGRLPGVSLFVNVGANSGFYCCMALRAGVRTVALEPEPANFQFLCSNMAVNGHQDDVEVLAAAAGCPPPRIARIFGMKHTASLSAEFRRGGSMPADADTAFGQFTPVVGLDDVVLGHRWMSGRLLVLVDVEGWERHVIEGAPGLLALDPKPFWIVEVLPDSISGRTEPTDVFSIMSSRGYRAYRISDRSDPVEVAQDEIPSLMQAQDFWNYLFIDARLSLPDLPLRPEVDSVE